MQKFILLLAVASILIAGCSKTEETPTTTGDSSSSSTSAATPPPSEPTNTAPGLGQMAQADHFSVMLVTDPEKVKKGENKFLAQIGHHGSPSTGATVKLTFLNAENGKEMANAEMKHVSEGRFESTVVLQEPGDYDVLVEIDEQGHLGSTRYRFNLAE
jgi:hypothetical protein